MTELTAVRTPAEFGALRVIALMEAVKGFIVFGAGFGMLSLLHRDVRQVAVALVTRLHLDPERHFAGVFLNAASTLTDARLWGLAALALAYSALRWIEAYGLWLDRRWASWLGAAGRGDLHPGGGVRVVDPAECGQGRDLELQRGRGDLPALDPAPPRGRRRHLKNRTLSPSSIATTGGPSFTSIVPWSAPLTSTVMADACTATPSTGGGVKAYWPR